VLCFHHFGWDLLDAMRESGFAEAEALRIADPERGLPEPQWVLRARTPGPRVSRAAAATR
jgi:hypothetical protein